MAPGNGNHGQRTGLSLERASASEEGAAVSENDQESLGDLEDAETREGFDFPPAQRKVITQAYDLSVNTLVEQWDSELLILPEIQREYIWDDPRASRLIESLLLNIPIPVVYFAETPDARYEIIDGHQRIKSIVRYLKNELRLGSLAVLSEYSGRRFFELPDREQRLLRMRALRAVIVSTDSHPSMKFEIFERLNTGSIALNAQELRNSLYRGTLNRLLHDLAKDPVFRRAIGRVSVRKRMVDEELVLRYLALREVYAAYRPPLKRFLNEFMEARRDPDEEELERLARSFRETMARTVGVLGGSAFRVTDLRGRPSEGTVNRALFDAQMLSFSSVSTPSDAIDRPRVLASLGHLYADVDFDDSIRRATGDRSRLHLRVTGVAEALRSAGVEVVLPDSWDR
jgi:hypothetical protein